MCSTRVRRGLLGLSACFVAAFGLATVGPVAAANGFVPGSPGLGDPFFPNAGNGGYDVGHYSLTVGYEPSANQLSGAPRSPPRRRSTCPASTSTCGASQSRACSSTTNGRRSRATVSRSS